MRLVIFNVFDLLVVLAAILYAFLEAIFHLVCIFKTILRCKVVKSIEGQDA